MSKRAAKEAAQEMLMHGIGNVLGYWAEDQGNRAMMRELGLSEEEFNATLQQQADRVARLLGFDSAWSN